VFGRFRLDDNLRERTLAVKATVDGLDPDELLNRSVDDVVDQLVEEFDIDPPTIHWEGAEQAETTETTIEVVNERLRALTGREGMRSVPATRVVVAVPVSGTLKLLGADGNPYLERRWGRTAILGDELLVWNEWRNPVAEQTITSWWNNEQDEIKRQVGPVLSGIQVWRDRLAELARTLVQDRRESDFSSSVVWRGRWVCQYVGEATHPRQSQYVASALRQLGR
jgi:hypothetical protein